jgi:uncharacterized protein (TIGR03905 family)
MTYQAKGVCCQEINFDIENGVLTAVSFSSGCDGNLKGISKLATGMKVEDVIKRVQGITCKNKGTSCPDQLAEALRQAI